MGEANEGNRSRGGGSGSGSGSGGGSGREMENLSLQIEKYPRDLLHRLMSSSNAQQQSQNAAFDAVEGEGEGEGEDDEDSEELELNLGLSLGGRFGVDKNANKKSKLIRSSSIIGTMPLVRGNNNDETTTFSPPVSYPNLIRTSSLPTETEEEWRKRKELQTLRRMAAKRRRSEKQRNSAKADREAGSSLEEEKRDITTAFSSSVGPPFGFPTWAVAARQALLGAGADLVIAKSKASAGIQNTSQGSVESHGGSSSGMSELESKAIQGSSSGGEASPAGQSSNQLSQERNQENTGPSGTKAIESKCATSGSKTENPSKNPSAGGSKGREIGMNAMEDMPCVFTKGDGPNGRRIDGILYRYGKGEDVRIMCVCHGKFLSPAEFVKHAGGGDVAHPLKHIVINPSSTSFL
ncbi:ninja-family protein AFP1-like [Humulus lupulus]|uniref:ninja-family protein AFP1-like n=1 Tax=Humulus lupulus TaxID=3486 RepID=UPI002B412B9E|nr:ninja-family protein AFP1-like [Humulus lupulus]